MSDISNATVAYNLPDSPFSKFVESFHETHFLKNIIHFSNIHSKPVLNKPMSPLNIFSSIELDRSPNASIDEIKQKTNVDITDKEEQNQNQAGILLKTFLFRLYTYFCSNNKKECSYTSSFFTKSS